MHGFLDELEKGAAKFPVSAKILQEARRVGKEHGRRIPKDVRGMPWLKRTVKGEVAKAKAAPEGSWLGLLRTMRKSMKTTGRLPKEIVTKD